MGGKMGVAVGPGTKVAVGGMGVLVGNGVSVGTGVLVGHGVAVGKGVLVGNGASVGAGVAVGRTGVEAGTHPLDKTSSNTHAGNIDSSGCA
jgi:UDP-3-O-[3-hydroxymyristoyl] glucosamine N-acyltransferase